MTNGSEQHLLVISQLPPPLHGSTAMTRTLLETLDRLGYRWTLVDRRFSKSVGEVGRFSLGKAIQAVAMPFRLLSTQARIRSKTSVFFVTNRPFSFLVDVALGELLRWTCRERIYYIHTTGFRQLADRGRTWGILVKRLLQGATRVVCLGPSLAEDVTPWVEMARISFIPNTTTPRATSENQSERSHVLYLSNLMPEKGADDFLKVAISLTAADGPKFVVAGAQSDASFSNKLKSMLAASGKSEKISIIGPTTSDSHKWSLLSESRALMFPSRYQYEAQPLTIVEAMSAGVPVVAYAVGGIPDLITDGRTGFLVTPGDVTELERCTKKLIEDPALVARMSEASRSRFEAEFSPGAFSRKWHELLRSVA